MDFSQPHVVSAVDGHLKKLFKEYCHDLRRYYLGLPNNVDKSRFPKDDVAQDQWASLCVWWETEEFQKKSATNKRSRSKLEVLHRGGAKNFARHRYDLTNPETNEQPNDIELYRLTHHNLDKGWVAPRAEENYDRMVEVSTQPTEEGGEPLTAGGAREVVLGKRPGYACGLGYGVLAPTRATASATAAAAAAGAAATAAARAEMDEMRQRAEVAENQLRQLTDQHHQLTDQQAIQQRQIEYLMSRLGGSPNVP